MSQPSLPPQSERRALAIAQAVYEAFEDYHAHFSAITARAKQRFETRDWSGARDDAVARIALYDHYIAECMSRLRAVLLGQAHDRALWMRARDHYAALLSGLIDQELYKTFYNTLTRRYFGTHGVDAEIEFIALDIEPTDAITVPVARHTYAVSPGRLTDMLVRVLGDYAFAVPYAHRTRCAAAIAVRLLDDLAHWGEHPVRSVELLETVFYRERRAYLVGRVFGEHRFSPCVIALINDDAGMRAEAVLTRRSDVAQLFSNSRSYFQADLSTVGDAVVFLRSLLTHKPVDELYTMLGRAKQGKTERYRTFFSHFQAHPSEQLVHADGTPGMVMVVFTLPSYPLVFKLIRDRFAYPKTMSRAQVEGKYELVFQLDRIGRLLDAQPYRFLRFPKARFSPALLQELQTSCAMSLSEDGDDVLIALCYVQRRLRPLNLYLREQLPEAAHAAALDYGQAIKDMARNNIFPGDMLLKNFGITRHQRAVFYDYDELCLITECTFRDWPTPTTYEEQMAAEPWFHVGPRDVFPERFALFMGLPSSQLEAVKHQHPELFNPQWWRDLQSRLREDDYPDTPPYAESRRLA
ncbi:isocitrate dehydrogenase [Xanthomonas vasicola pv. vasculorum NCPPB 895]|uniref:bifunctional isocitrate dehydrogenase kinase/phosphatase n=1 Tax=Xanthomonas vasicola TaxID=56459 RepID=UPI00034A7465|nr:bifunctional isocitrate dehydrogenase kinase/phosphatase [Xanthomonas vasicola]AZR28389.1 bifunctional isocitrate dehydrogenase kinase/phosphatase [Xanthomonas vasicola pv. arecae]KEZ94733.1 isocitrate dehydrogenase [Xanthomonas vasicola pv. vasculorum NCPPB 895]MBV7305814.1 bifunctional isocitrate dehydrogenase kinase/phosphatase [Xanthomonas vasicola pv. vasculorum]MDO6935022.1 bifunctional isocitrate dehydrogenase kinase/phosphatase [Xanthomonas vasicola]MDO6939857.1 bifunctional isocitr